LQSRPGEVVTSNLVAQLNERWRVVVAHDGTQWILQRFHAARAAKSDRTFHRFYENDWRPRAHCRTRAALERCAGLYAGDVDPAARAILAALPGHIDWGDPKPAPVSRKKTMPKPSLTSGHDGGS
jgi:hypothetical protein